jgi:tetratricopeptide (TPR) repeat protein
VSANEEAIGHLRRALALLETLSGTRERHQLELGLQLSIGAALSAARGWAHPEYEHTFTRARELAAHIGQSSELSRVLSGMADAYCVKGALSPAREIAREAVAAAEHNGDAFDLIVAHHSLGGPLLLQGSFSQGLRHCEQAVTSYDPATHGPLAYTVGHDCGVCAHGYAAICHAYLGRADMALARRVDHPPSLATALFQAGAVDFQRGDRDRMREGAEELVGLGERLGLPWYLAMGRLHGGWVRLESGEGEEGLAELQQAQAELARLGSQFEAPKGLAMLADGLRRVGRHPEALGALALGVTQAEQQGQHFYDAELHRLRAEILLDTDGNAIAEAEALFGQSLEIARRQEAKTFELRAATSLARLWHRLGKPTAARDLLAPVYAWFTEGFDTRDLIAAKTLLAELGGADPPRESPQ